MIINFGVPENSGKFLSKCTIGGFARRAQLHEVSYRRISEIHCVSRRFVPGNVYLTIRVKEQKEMFLFLL
jgi:hypothetical protein